MMEVWWVAYARMSSVLHGSARTILILVAISGQPLIATFRVSKIFTNSKTLVGHCRDRP